MTVAEKIKIYRKKEGLTQEQIANCLGVSTPAVNKWERGNTYPDVTLLPALARLLKIDMNELFSFHDELTEVEIGQFNNELSQIALAGKLEDAFEMAQEKIRQYPHCDLLIYTAAAILEGAVVLKSIDDSEKNRYYNETILNWYEKAAKSENDKVRNMSISMLVSKYVKMERYDEAEMWIEKIPGNQLDVTVIKTTLLEHKEGVEAAEYFLETKLIQAATNIQSYLFKLIGYAGKSENYEKAEEIASVAERMVANFCLWDYGKAVPHIIASLNKKDEIESIHWIKEGLREAEKQWRLKESALYYRYAEKLPSDSMLDVGKSYIPALIHEMKTGEEYDFLRDNIEFQEVLKKYEDIK